MTNRVSIRRLENLREPQFRMHIDGIGKQSGDTTAPTLLEATPADNATDVSLSGNIILLFNEQVKAGTGNIVIHRSSDDSVFATIAVTDSSQVGVNTYTIIDPTNDYESGTGYYVTIDPGAIVDMAGNPFAGISSPTALNFFTVPLVNITADTTLTSIVAPAGYDHVTYAISNGATLTLTHDINTSLKIGATGLGIGGNLISNATITTTGTAITGGGVAVTNGGAIIATVASGYYAISATNFTNTGTLTSIGGGGYGTWGGAINNLGTITTDEIAVDAFDCSLVSNSGTIHSNHGVGLYLHGSEGYRGTNSGTIYGETIGLELTVLMTNTGLIKSPGLAVSFEGYGSLINRATGIIDGKIGAQLFGHTFNSKVDNYGTINGDVDFGRTSGSIYGSSNVFIARPGSALNGNLVLGDGNDMFVTNIVNTGAGQFAGVSGTVTGGGTDALRYLVTADVSVNSLNPSTLFGNVDFDLANNAHLTLVPGAIRFDRLGFAGSGVVDLTVDISGASGYPMLQLNKTSMQSIGGGTVPTALDFTSHGALNELHDTANWLPSMVLLDGTSKFTNAGTITLKDTNATSATAVVAVEGAGSVVNSGTISLYNADGICDIGTTVSGSGDLSVVNSGTINRLAGDTFSRGIVNCSSVANTGTISTGGRSVILKSDASGVASLINSGQITSANAEAVTWNWYSIYGATVTNQAGGSITGATYGVAMGGSGGSVTNAGTISGGAASVHFDTSGTLTLQTGSVLIGDAVGTLGYQAALILQGNGSASNAFVNFTTLDAQGPGTWTLSGTSSITATTVSGGTLNVTGALTSGFTVQAGATLRGTTSSLLAQGTLNDNGTVQFDQAAAGTFAGTIGGSGTLIKQGAGALTLSGTNTFTGKTTISAGTLTLGAGGSIAASSEIADNAAFDISLTTSGAMIKSLSGTGTVALGSKTLTISNGATNFSGVIGGTGGLTVAGGTQTLSGANTYSGGTLVKSGGTLKVSSNGNLGAAAGGLTLGDAASSGTLQFGAVFALGTTRAITMGAGGGRIDTNGFDIGISQAISGTGSLSKVGAGTLTLSGGFASFTAADAIKVVAGSLVVQGALSGTGTVLVGSGATFTLDASATAAGNTVAIDAGSSGAAILKGGSGNDTFTSGGGNDTLNGGVGDDMLNGGAGSDTADYSGATSGVTVNLVTTTAQAVGGGQGSDTLNSIENLTGSAYADTLIGDGNNNILVGGGGADSLRPGMGSDTVSGGNGDDSISFTGGRFDASDAIDGGAGNDLLWLNGDYSGGNAVVMNATTLTNVESIAVGAGFNYSLTTADATVGAGKALSVDATSLGAGNSLYFDGSAETDGSFTLLTGAGADTLIGGGGGDTFRAGGGYDHVSGNGGNDTFSFSLGHLDAADVIDGGTGTDMVWLNTDYTGANALVMNATTLTNVETIALSSAYSFNLTTVDATVAAGKKLTVDGSSLGAGKTLTFNGSAETDGSFVVIGGAGGDTLTGGNGNDTLSGRAGNDTLRPGYGVDVVSGGDGDDTINFVNGKLSAADMVDGGTGTDTVLLNGDYTGANAVTFNSTTITNVESIGFAAGFNYSLKSSDGTVAAGKTLTIDASTLGSANSLTFDGSTETNGSFIFVSGSGADNLKGGSGADTFKYDAASRSSGLNYDTINALNFANDTFDLASNVTAIDAAKTSGSLSTASFDSDMTARMFYLGAHHAILFTPNAGTLAGQTFMVIDCNGTAGYQSGQDMVIRLNGYSGTLTAGAFH